MSEGKKFENLSERWRTIAQNYCKKLLEGLAP